MKNCRYCRPINTVGFIWGEDDIGVFAVIKEGVLKIHSPEQCSNFEIEMEIDFCPKCGTRLAVTEEKDIE